VLYIQFAQYLENSCLLFVSKLFTSMPAGRQSICGWASLSSLRMCVEPKNFEVAYSREAIGL
jgi:hypothetical protein